MIFKNPSIELIEKLYHFPKLDKKISKESYNYSYGYCRSYSDHKINNISPYTLVNRIAEYNIGKSFNMAFRYFCKKVPKYQQWMFLQEFGRNTYHDSKFIVDSNGNIDYNKNHYSYYYKIYYKKYRFYRKGNHIDQRRRSEEEKSRRKIQRDYKYRLRELVESNRYYTYEELKEIKLKRLKSFEKYGSYKCKCMRP